RDRVHPPHREGPARLMATTTTLTVPGPAGRGPAARTTGTTSTVAASRTAFAALLVRDVVVLSKNLKTFIPRTLIQPFLLVFVFPYVFPRIGNGPTGAAGSAFATTLVAGVLGLSIMFQGIQAVSLPLVQEFGYTREIEDRVLAP